MYEVVQIRLREAGKISYYNVNNIEVNPGDYCIVEIERGIDYGQVVSEAEMVLAPSLKRNRKGYPLGLDADIEQPLRKIIRLANKEDRHQIEENQRRIKNVLTTCGEKIREHKLDMKLIEAEYSFDRTKIIFYFTAEGRVDFRNLVRDLAHIFRARIELRQIGVRDEARMLGGFGCCGRPLCCAEFLKDFEPVTIRMAKKQNLPLNPPKISGLCGRLMCCLSYEYETYRQLLKGLPKEGAEINTPEGKGKVVSVNALNRAAIVDLGEGKQIKINL